MEKQKFNNTEIRRTKTHSRVLPLFTNTLRGTVRVTRHCASTRHTTRDDSDADILLHTLVRSWVSTRPAPLSINPIRSRSSFFLWGVVGLLRSAALLLSIWFGNSFKRALIKFL